MNTTHIYWFAYFGVEEPSVRYRGKYPLAILKEQYGITYDLIIPSYKPRKVLKFLKAYFTIFFNRKKGSAIVFEKIRTKRIYATALKVLLKVHPEKTIYDIDDADYIKFPPETVYYFMGHCEKCTVGSTALQNVAGQFNNRTLLLTSPVIDHDNIKISRNRRFTIGWVGYYNAHRESLLTLFFPALLNTGFPVDLVIRE